MNINDYISKNVGDDSVHDDAYASALHSSFARYNGLSTESLIKFQATARTDYKQGMSTHRATADCVVIYELLKELREKPE